VDRLDASYINRTNKIRVLDLIRNSSTISRAELTKKAALSAPTITRIVDALIHQNHMVEEVGIGDSDGGRPPNLIRFAGADKYVIGIDLGTTHIDGIVANLNADIIVELRVPTVVGSGYQEVMHRTSTLINDLVEQSGVDQKNVLGVGVAVAGLVDKDKKIVEFSPDFGWHDVNVGLDIHKEISLPIVFDNVTRVMAMGERHFGYGRTVDNFICVNIGYGIGAGIIVDGKPFYGTHGMSGEFGHIVIDPASEVQCMCGNRGCLEALASGHGITLAAERGLEQGEKSVLNDGTVFTEPVTAEAVAHAAADGDQFALQVITTAARQIGLGIANLINLFDPQAIIIGGGVTSSGPLLFDTVQQVVSERSLSRHSKEIAIIQSSFGSRASVMGAISLILSEVLNLSIKLPAG
jgi:glucokinase-like ROK family protein